MSGATGYEVKMYADISGIHRALDVIAENSGRIAEALEILAEHVAPDLRDAFAEEREGRP